MFKKNSILDRKVRATAYAANIESEDRQYNQEVAYWSSKRDKNSETHVSGLASRGRPVASRVAPVEHRSRPSRLHAGPHS